MNEKWGIMEDKYKPNWYIPKVMSQENTPCWTYEATKITDKINEKRGIMEDKYIPNWLKFLMSLSKAKVMSHENTPCWT